jgi:hypothetical protein
MRSPSFEGDFFMLPVQENAAAPASQFLISLFIYYGSMSF